MLRQRSPRQKKPNHLAFIRCLPCIACHSRQNIQAAHIRMASLLHGKRSTGVGEKSSDQWTLPLCASCHADQHSGSESAFWRGHGINPFDMAACIYLHSGDEDAAGMVIKMARRSE